VRWQCAPNGEVAVKKWRQGGFHLVLMDIQLPVMNGLEAAKEIRRLERLNGIGVFSRTGHSSGLSAFESSSTESAKPPVSKQDVLENLPLFKSPVIIVALTASSLQSDRHEALAAGCNDFLTKVCRVPGRNYPWGHVLTASLPPAGRVPMVRAEGDGVGLHAGSDRLWGMAEMAGLCRRPVSKYVFCELDERRQGITSDQQWDI
jgi:CheY-like chemotaxis protein